MLNIFSLHGDYFRNDENRLTGNVMFLLSEARHTFLAKLLQRIDASTDLGRLESARIEFQVYPSSSDERGIPDAQIRISDDVHVLIEAKIQKRT